jgi:dynein heavy chain
MMNEVQKDKRILYQCKEGNKKKQLEMVLAELEKCQKSLTNYLDSKRFILSRFYFISDEDLL